MHYNNMIFKLIPTYLPCSTAAFRAALCSADADPAGNINSTARTFATRLNKAGADPKTVQTPLSHSTLNLTMQLYTDGNAMDLKGAINGCPTSRWRSRVLGMRQRAGLCSG